MACPFAKLTFKYIEVSSFFFWEIFPIWWLLLHFKTCFLSKVNIGNANCARATAFIFDTRTGVLVRVSTFFLETENVSIWGGLESTILGFMPNALTYQKMSREFKLNEMIQFHINQKWISWCNKKFHGPAEIKHECIIHVYAPLCIKILWKAD